MRIWKLPDLSLSQYLHTDKGIIYNCCFSPDGNLIACSTVEGSIIVWDVASSKEIIQFKHHSKACFSIAWSQLKVECLLSTSSDCTAVVFVLPKSTVEELTAISKMSSNRSAEVSLRPVTATYTHPAPIFGGSWSIFSADGNKPY